MEILEYVIVALVMGVISYYIWNLKDNDEKEEYYKCFRSFIEYTEDFNFRNEDEDNQTILMEACRLGLTQVIDLILKQSSLYILFI